MLANDIEVAERRALVGRLLAWQGLRRADKLCRLLQLLDESAVEAPLSEKEIAARLFPRPASHDTAVDSIVRVSVRQLRFKLQEYFAGPGAAERWTVEIPKGEYALRFAERTPLAPTPPVEPPAPAAPPTRRWWLSLAGATGAGLAAGFVAGRLTQPAAHDLPANLLLRAMDNGKYSLTIVPGDAGTRQLIYLGARELSLTEYLSPQPETPEPAPGDVAGRLMRWAGTTPLVTGPHAAVVGSLVAATGELRTRTAVRHPKDVSIRSLQQNSYAFLAARLMNPIVDVFEPKLTLRCDNESPGRRIGIVDTLAKPGEKARYISDEPRGVLSFGRIALLPNLGRDGGRILLLSGLGAVGTEAAALVASDPAWLRVLEERLPPGQLYFEALVEASSAKGTPVDLKVLIVRPLKTENSKS